MVVSNKKIFILIFLFMVLFVAIIFWSNQKTKNSLPSLRVYSYSSFSGKHGPGRELAEIFKDKTGYDIEFINADSALIMLTKFMADKKPVDLFIGIDQFSKQKSLQEISWKPLDLAINKSQYIDFMASSPFLTAYNWSPMTFIYREGEVSGPEKWQDLFVGDYKLSLPDPRTSSPGGIFLFWFYQQFKENFSQNIKKLNKKVSLWAPSWSAAYGFFKNKNTNMTFSYVTSLAYHLQNNEKGYQVANFSRGHPYQVEYVGVPESCKYCGPAQQFIEFMLSKQAQEIIMKKNVMLPVLKGVTQGTVFESLPKLKLISNSEVVRFTQNRSAILEQWKKAQRD